ncbi:MAG: VOC family protein [Holophagales bacterium]|nr:VOC family protein [Holophagales bacterium]MYC10181.1 VOC family protein [Holophagales bacterium]
MRPDSPRVTAPGFIVSLAVLGLAFSAAPAVVAEEFDHVHLVAPDTMAAAKWYNELFGGRLGKSGPFDSVFYGNDILKVREGEPTSGSGGTSLDHIGFSVADVAATLEACEAAGGKVVGAARHVEAAGFTFGFCEDPWGTRIEVIDDMDHGGAPGLHHVHVFSNDAVSTAAWYAKQFGGEVVAFKGLAPLHSILYDNGGDETWLIVNQVPGERTGTDGTVVDHIGWHTTEYDSWLERLRGDGVKFVVEPMVLDAGHRIAYVEGPDGTKIELVENLAGGVP